MPNRRHINAALVDAEKSHMAHETTDDDDNDAAKLHSSHTYVQSHTIHIIYQNGKGKCGMYAHARMFAHFIAKCARGVVEMLRRLVDRAHSVRLLILSYSKAAPLASVATIVVVVVVRRCGMCKPRNEVFPNSFRSVRV